jgi:hypothetical protein
MKRSIFALLTTMFIAFGAQLAYAQPGRGMGMDPEQQIKELIAQLDIATEQEAAFREAMGKVNAMRMESMGQMAGMREGQGRGQGQGADAAHDGHGQDADAAHDGHGAGGGQAGANAGGGGRGMEMMAQRRAEMEAKTQAILAPVLSSAQLEKYKELEAARMAQMMPRMQR